MPLVKDFERTLAFRCVEPLVEELGVHVLFWKETRTRSSLKVEMVVFSQGGVSLALMERLHHLLLPRLQAFCAGLSVSLDISSPGTQRTLKTLYELSFFIGKEMLFFAEGFQHALEGFLEDVEEEEIVVKTHKNERFRLSKVELKGIRIKT